jgi:serine/threonine-protein kinase
MRRAILTILCAASVGLGSAAPAQGANGFPFVPTAATLPKVQPVGYFKGPCGLAVDSTGRLYVSDYYHHTVDLFNVNNGLVTYLTQLTNVDPLDGPCGLALDSSDHIYVNDFDRNVVGFGAYPAFGAGAALAGAGVDEAHPTGVAVDPSSGDVYVDDRTYITGYEPSGAQLMDGAAPLKIGAGSLGEGYGLAIDSSGRFYVADASTDTVKVYAPAISKTAPQLTITGPPSGFSSLRQATLAVDWSRTGNLYVVDDLQPTYTEEPAAQVEVFTSTTGSYLGVLSQMVIDARPAGLAVDNSKELGDVYVTSGNTDLAGILRYGPNSQVASASPPTVGLAAIAGSGSGIGPFGAASASQTAAISSSASPSSAAPATMEARPRHLHPRHRHHRRAHRKLR